MSPREPGLHEAPEAGLYEEKSGRRFEVLMHYCWPHVLTAEQAAAVKQPAPEPVKHVQMMPKFNVHGLRRNRPIVTLPADQFNELVKLGHYRRVPKGQRPSYKKLRDTAPIRTEP